MFGTRSQQPAAVVILNTCALLWTFSAPPAKVSDFITAAVAVIMRHAGMTITLHVVFDRCHNLSNKSCCRQARQRGSKREIILTEDTLLPEQARVFNDTANKEWCIQIVDCVIVL